MRDSVAQHSTSGTGNESEGAVPTGEEREALREELLGVNAQNMLEFQNRATRKFGPSAGPFIRQIVFWDGERSAAGEGWMWKSRREMCEETGLNRKPQEKARKMLKAAGVLEEELRPVGPMKRQTLHYRANLNRLLDLLFPPEPGTGTAKGDQVQGPLKGNQYRDQQGGPAVQESTAGEDFHSPPYPPAESGGQDEGKEKAGSVRGPSDTSSLGAGRKPAQKRAGEGRDGKRSPRKRRPRGGVTSPAGIEAILSYKARRDTYDPIGLTMEKRRKQLALVAERWDFASEEDPPMKLRYEISPDREDCDRMLKRLRRMVRAADASPPGDRVQSADSPSLPGTPETDARPLETLLDAEPIEEF